MPIDSSIVGQALGPRNTEITLRRAMAVAAASSDCNPFYLDDLREDGSVAPPLFSVTLEWPLVLGLRAQIPGATSQELRRGVHATHTAIFHRLLRPGELVTTAGTVVAVEQRRAGVFVQSRLETRDEHGQPLTTTYNGSVFLGVQRSGPDRRIDSPPDAPIFSGSGERWSETVEVVRDAAHVYTECADIYNPIHTERAVALAAGLPDIILHGTATLALAARAVVDRDCGGDPRRLAAISCRFGALVIPGSCLTIASGASAPASEGIAFDYEVRTEDGQPAIRDGWAIVRGGVRLQPSGTLKWAR